MGAEEQEMRPHRHSSADVPIGVLMAPHLHMLVGTWLLGTPRRWVSGATLPRFPHHSLTRFAAAKEPSQQAQGCSATEHCLAGCRTAALLCHTGKREAQEKKKIKLLLEGERLLLFLRSSVGCAALRAPARPWRLHRAAAQDGVEVSTGCGAAGLFLIEVFINHIQDNR